MNEFRKLDEIEAFKLLSRYGIKSPRIELARSREEALKIAERIGFPVALKVASKDIVHKTDVGGISLDIKNSEQLEKEFDEMIKRVKKKTQAQISGVFVQKMVKGGYELILGGKRDQVFGPVVMLGAGGIYVEAFEDVSFRIAPIDQGEAMRMIEELKFSKVLKGLRGEPANLKEIARAVASLSKLMVCYKEIAEVDINPLLVTKEAIALDARVISTSDFKF
jgi:acetyl-CoA synthetase (ADP-forming)